MGNKTFPIDEKKEKLQLQLKAVQQVQLSVWFWEMQSLKWRPIYTLLCSYKEKLCSE